MSEEDKRIDREFGALLRMHRTTRGLSHADLAAAAGLSESSIESYELGLNRVSLVRLVRIARAMGETPRTLISQLEERMLICDHSDADIRPQSIDFMASNRGRQLIEALARCENDDLLNALADLVLSTTIADKTSVRSPPELMQSSL